jgi:UDP-2,3-diacylglucosamine hydrolase
MKPKTRLNNRQGDVLSLELGVRGAQSTNELGSADLAPDQIVRVIHHLHLIGFGVPYPEFDGVSRAAIGLGSHVRGKFENAPLGLLCKGFDKTLTCAVLKGPCYIVSDAHLGVASPQTERSFVAFLRGLVGEAESLVINGDLFDFWFEWKTVIPRRSFRALAALAELKDAGVEILWVAGNHDCWGGEVLREDVGISYLSGPWEGTIAGWKVRVEHGDGLRDKEDRGYRLIRPIMRNQLAIKIFRLMHPDWASSLAQGSSNASRTYRARDEGRGLRSYAAKQLEKATKFEVLVYGHSHVPALEKMEGGGVFANAGSWLDAPTFLRVTDEAIELLEWDGSSKGKCLNSVNR